jgi:hypothetical protein
MIGSHCLCVLLEWMNAKSHNFIEDHIMVQNQFSYSHIDDFICLGIYIVACNTHLVLLLAQALIGLFALV